MHDVVCQTRPLEPILIRKKSCEACIVDLEIRSLQILVVDPCKSSFSSPFKNALFTSSYLTIHLCERAMLRIILIVVGFATGLNVSWKSKLGI